MCELDSAEHDGARLRKYRNRKAIVRITDDPGKRMSSGRRPPDSQTTTDAESQVEDLARWFEGKPSARERFAWVLRDSLDELLDGQRTGRWCYQHLKKTERTYLGTAIEVNFTNEFELPDGAELDWNIGGREVDCKFSKDFGGWEIPMEMYLCAEHGDQSGTDNHLALLLWMNDDESQWAAGVVQIRDDLLRFKADGSGRQYNRDNKRRLSDRGIERIRWLWGGLQKDLPPNLLRRLSARDREKILSPNSGQQRVNALFREVPGVLITRSTLLTVAQQDDAMKRARDARLPKHLGGKGYLVLGHQEADPHIAQCLRLPVPLKGEFVSCRVVRAAAGPEPRIWLGNEWWRLAHATDPPSPGPDRKLYRGLDPRSIRRGPESQVTPPPK